MVTTMCNFCSETANMIHIIIQVLQIYMFDTCYDILPSFVSNLKTKYEAF